MFLFSAVTLLLIGYAVVSQIKVPKLGYTECILFRAGLTPGVAFGLSSIWSFALVALGAPSWSKFAVEGAAAAAALVWIALRAQNNHRSHLPIDTPKASQTPIGRRAWWMESETVIENVTLSGFVRQK